MAEREGLNSYLTLIMEKGPLSGRALNFLPRSKIQIGRIARGNTLAVKDAGVSSKHLSISFQLAPGRVGHWTVSDLGSSNGTFLNELLLEPFAPTQLSRGDVIKIGEETSIKVMVEEVAASEDVSKVGRNRPRRGRNLGVVDENTGLNLGEDENNDNVRCGRVRRVKGVLQTSEVSESKEFNEGKMEIVRRETRGTLENKPEEVGQTENLGSRNRCKKDGKKLAEVGIEDVKEMDNVRENEARNGEKVSPNEIRSMKKENISGLWENLVVNRTEGTGGNGGQKESLRRRTRSMRKGQNSEVLGENCCQNSKVIERILPIEVKEKASLRRTTRSSRNIGNLETLEENGGRQDKKTRKGTRRKRNLMVETLPENVEDEEIEKEKDVENLNSEREEIVEMKASLPMNEVVKEEESNVIAGLVERIVNLGVEACERVASTSGVKDGGSNEVDLEKMTLGEWFDYLEVHLPKQIVDTTEEMILGMRLKAEKFCEFMLQQNNSNKNVEVPAE